MAGRTAEPYCEAGDIQLGDIQPPRSLSVDLAVNNAADEIDAALGQVYKLPLAFDMSKSADRADALLLKKINSYLATGRILAIVYAGHEGSELHAYGRSMLSAALAELTALRDRKIILESADMIVDDDNELNGPLISNKDPYSFVDSFYQQPGTAFANPSTWGAGYNG